MLNSQKNLAIIIILGAHLAVEIERKFSVRGNNWRNMATGINIKQGYVSVEKDHTVRIRIIESKAFLTIKGKSTGAKRLEYEYEIPNKDANELLINICKKPIINKIRYKINFKGIIWEVDEFFGENKGLILAEVELEDEEQKIEIPDWIGTEVTGNPKYYNANLISNPFCNWSNI